jgi:NAD(P)H-hydrate repair Nnr-like enzyme with NAD(P)H-hydrate epimerase domain
MRSRGRQAAGVAIGADPGPRLERGDLAIDALLGIGASRAPGDAIARAIATLASVPCPVLAIDLPSGLHAGTGQPLARPACAPTTA